MASEPNNLRAVNEIGKIYSSLTDKKSLCDFFPQSVLMNIDADAGYLFLAGQGDDVWLESQTDDAQVMPPAMQKEAAVILKTGKAVRAGRSLGVPLIVRNHAIGVACFTRAASSPPFEQKDLEIAFDLASQMAGALKNTLLFEQNLEMEKLAAIGKSMGMVMHEIKNIVQLATFAEEWLVRGIQKNNKPFQERGLEGFRKALKEMNGFVQEILSLTKNYKIQPQPVDLRALTLELETDLKEKAQAHEVALSFEVDPALGFVDMEERSIYRALLNLIKNAMEACNKEKSWIHVTAKSVDAQSYQIRIQDNGQGMSDEVRARLFQAFFSTKGEKGTGLGLMVVQKTIKAHAGKLEVESQEGVGTTFIITLPKMILA